MKSLGLQMGVCVQNETLRGKRCTLSGCGNVAVYCAEKLLEMGATVLTFSDSEGMIYCLQGFSPEDVQRIKTAKAADAGLRVSSFADVSEASLRALAHEDQNNNDELFLQIGFYAR